MAHGTLPHDALPGPETYIWRHIQRSHSKQERTKSRDPSRSSCCIGAREKKKLRRSKATEAGPRNDDQ